MINTSSLGSWYYERYACCKASLTEILLAGSNYSNFTNKSKAIFEAFGNN